VGLDRQRADAAGQQLTPVPGLSSTTAAGLARRITPDQWRAVKTGLAAVTERMLGLLPPERAAALTGGPVTIDLDATDVEVYGRKKRGVTYMATRGSGSAARMWRPGRRPRSCWPPTWDRAPTTPGGRGGPAAPRSGLPARGRASRAGSTRTCQRRRARRVVSADRPARTTLRQVPGTDRPHAPDRGLDHGLLMGLGRAGWW